MTIDSHQHFWKFDPSRHDWINEDMRAIRRDFMPEDLWPLLKARCIDGSVVVQVDQNEEENQFLLRLAEEYDFIKGVVGWVDFKMYGLEEELQRLSTQRKLKGFRHIVQGEPRGFLNGPSFLRGVKALRGTRFTYDLLVYHYQLEESIKFVRKIGDVKLVVDHLAKPSISTGETESWKKNMQAIASFENVSVKLSGMVTEASWQGWSEKDFEPYLDTMFNLFGVRRLMYGSDWPVCLVAATYDEQAEIINSYISRLSSDERERVLGGNAVDFYGLPKVEKV